MGMGGSLSLSVADQAFMLLLRPPQIRDLPGQYYETLKFLVGHLKTIADHSEKNKVALPSPAPRSQPPCPAREPWALVSPAPGSWILCVRDAWCSPGPECSVVYAPGSPAGHGRENLEPSP